MADLRYDPISGVWVAIARKRRERPTEFIPLEQVHKQLICPFCNGNEDETPASLAVYDAQGMPTEDGNGWMCRVIPNKYPSLTDDARTDCGPYSVEQRDGVQELIIPTPRHVNSISELTSEELTICFQAAQERIATLQESSAAEQLVLFLNCRYAAGASLGHIHFQIMGAPVLSHFVTARLKRNQEHFKSHGQGLVQTLMAWELEQGVRVVEETEHFVMLCPFASRYAFQVWIVPRNSESKFVQSSTQANLELANLCRSYVGGLERLIDEPAYNLLVNLSPNSQPRDFWFVEIFPRTTRAAGFELGSDVWVNPVPPETAAKRLKG